MKSNLTKCILLAGITMFMLSGAGVDSAFAFNNNINPVDSLGNEIQKQLADKDVRLQLYYPKSVSRLYTQAGFMPVWIKPQNYEGPAWQAMQMIDCVLQFGLSHADYHPKELINDQLHNILDTPKKVRLQQQALFDIMLTDAIINLINNLHYGKLNPEYPASKIDALTDAAFMADKTLTLALLQKKLITAIAAVQPAMPEYADLRRKLYLLEGLRQNNCYELPQAQERKIAINMERLRWINTGDRYYIHINIPSYTLKLHIKDSTCSFKVIVGRPETPTPTLQSAVNYLTTAPEWKVPAAMFAGTVLPNAINDTAYLNNNNYGIYSQAGDFIDPTPANLTKIKNNPTQYYARQTIGCDNALGLVVFRFDNVYKIYLHDTPQLSLFAKKNRALSNGCIRIEQARRFAILLLKNDDSADKLKALDKGLNTYFKQNIYLKKAMPIKITYLTCEIKDGELISLTDIYNLDNSLEMAFYGTDKPL
jgi:murein L,D-transpeptidase YcbB/YkuD